MTSTNAVRRTMRQPDEITYNGRMLAVILDEHRRWISGEGGDRANLWYADLGGTYLRGADLGYADLRYADLRYANLGNADLRDANLRGADLRYTNLGDANLAGANLAGSDLRGANLRDADLAGASLAGADLRDADLRDADLGGANLGDADLAGANLRGADLWGATGNMREVKSAHFSKWPITWTTAPDGAVTLQIGFQRHDLTLWEKSGPRWVSAMDPDVTAWWGRYRDVVLALVKASPATAYGQAKGE